jgi:4'-phosphopantetheinyl transferase
MTGNNSKIYLLKLPAVPQKRPISKCLLSLTKDERNRFFRFKKKKDSLLYLTGRYYIKKIISEKTKIPIEKIIIKTTKFGRPALHKPKIKNFDFNISHSGDYVAIAISNKKIGVDIEKIKPLDLEIAESYFTPKELSYIKGNTKDKLTSFYKIWTLKESYIKAIGKGLSHPLKSFYFTFAGNKTILNFKRKKKTDFNFKTHLINKDYILAICTHNKKIQLKKPSGIF